MNRWTFWTWGHQSVLCHIHVKSETQLNKNRNSKLCLFHIIQLFIYFISEVILKSIPLTNTLCSTYNYVQYKSISWLICWNLKKKVLWEGKCAFCTGLCHLWWLCRTNVLHDHVRNFCWLIVIVMNIECLAQCTKHGSKHFYMHHL